MKSTNELVQILNQQMEILFPQVISYESLREKLTVFINDLIQNDFQKLVAVLYKIDIDETKLKKLLQENQGEDAAPVIAELIIERELQKIETRKQFKHGK